MFSQFRKIREGEEILVAGDCSAGGLDYSCAHFLSRTHRDIPLVYHSKRLASEMTNDIHPVLENIQKTTGVKPVVAFERNNGGVFEMERLASLNTLGKFTIFKMPVIGASNAHTIESVRYGWDTNTATRPTMLSQLKDAIDKRLLTIYHKATIAELFSFVVMQSSSSWKAQAEHGAHDDLVMSLAIAWQLYQLVPEREDKQYMERYRQFQSRALEGMYARDRTFTGSD